MHLTAAFTIFLLGLAVSQAVPAPAPKIEESLDNNLNLPDVGEDKDRSKKSIIFASSPMVASGQAVNLLPPAQTVSIQAAAPAVQTVIQPALDTVQTLSYQPMVESYQTLNIQSAAQPIQAYSLQPAVQAVNIQAGLQPYQTVNLLPSQAAYLPPATVISEQVQPLNTVEVVQPAAAVEVVQPGRVVDIVQPARALDIVQPARALDIVQPMYSQAAVNYVQSMPAVEQVRVLSAPRPVVETITQEEIIRRPSNVVVANEEIVNVAGPVATVYKEQVPLYNEQVVVGPSRAFTLYSEPDLSASYVSGGQLISYQPQAVAALQSGGVIVDAPYSYMGLRERAVVDTVQRSNLIGGRVVERVSTNVYTDAC